MMHLWRKEQEEQAGLGNQDSRGSLGPANRQSVPDDDGFIMPGRSGKPKGYRGHAEGYPGQTPWDFRDDDDDDEEIGRQPLRGMGSGRSRSGRSPARVQHARVMPWHDHTGAAPPTPYREAPYPSSYVSASGVDPLARSTSRSSRSRSGSSLHPRSPPLLRQRLSEAPSTGQDSGAYPWNDYNAYPSTPRPRSPAGYGRSPSAYRAARARSPRPMSSHGSQQAPRPSTLRGSSRSGRARPSPPAGFVPHFDSQGRYLYWDETLGMIARVFLT